MYDGATAKSTAIIHYILRPGRRKTVQIFALIGWGV